MTEYQLAHRDDPVYKAKNNERAKRWYAANKQRALALRSKRYLENHEQELAANRAQYWAHRDERIAGRRLHYQQNREHALEYFKKYNLEHAEEARTRAKLWAKEHPIERRLHEGKRRTKIQGVKIVKTDIVNWESRICGICQKVIVGEFHIDHRIPLSRDGKHEVSNLQLTHPLCNLVKNNKLPEELAVLL